MLEKPSQDRLRVLTRRAEKTYGGVLLALAAFVVAAFAAWVYRPFFTAR